MSGPSTTTHTFDTELNSTDVDSLAKITEVSAKAKRKLSSDPDGAIIESRRSLELICREIYRRSHKQEPPKGRSLDKLLHDIAKHVPDEIRVLMRTVQGLGNLAAHPESPLSPASASVSVEALTIIEAYLGHSPLPPPADRRFRLRLLGSLALLVAAMIAIPVALSLLPDSPPIDPTEIDFQLDAQLGDRIEKAKEFKEYGNDAYAAADGFLNDDETGFERALAWYKGSLKILTMESGSAPSPEQRIEIDGIKEDLSIRIEKCNRQLEPKPWSKWWGAGKAGQK